MTSLILENADLNRLFPKCRPRGGPPPSPGASTQNSQPHESLCQKEAVSVTTSLTTSLTNTLATTFANTLTTTLAITSKNTHSTHSRAIPEDMIDLERDISDRTTNMVSSFAGDSQLSVGVSSGTGTVSGSLGTFSSLGTLNTKPLSSSSSSASGRSEDAQQYGSLPGSDQQSHSQQDDSGPEESPVYILTSAKGDRSYKLRDSRIIEIAGGREIFSQSRGKVAARKSRFLAASNSLNNEDIQIDNKLSVKRNNKSPNTQTIWELRSRCGDTRKQRSNREVTETVFSSEIHSVRHNPTKSIDYDSPKSNHSNRIINYDSILNSNNVEYGVSKNTVDLDYGLSKSCIDYQSNHTTPARSMAIVSDGEVVVFDDIDDNWQNLRLDLTSSNTNQVTPINLNLETEESQRGRIPPEPLSSSIGSTPSPTTAYHRNTSEFFKVITPASDCEVDSPSSERNHKVTRVIGELPIAQYSESPRRYGVRDTQLPCLLSSPSVYMTPRPGFPQRVLPTTPSHNEKEDTSAEIIVEKAVVETNINYSDDQAVNASPPSPKIEDEEEDSLKPSTIPTDNISNLVSSGGSTFDYLYEFSETRKVLEEFFKCPPPTKEKENSTESFPFQDLDYELRRQGGSAYVGQRLASGPPTTEEVLVHESPKKQRTDFPQNTGEHENNFLDLSVGTGSSEDLGETEVGLQVGHSRNFTLSPETTDCDSNCGDLDSEVSLMMMDNELIPASGLLGSVGDLGNNSDSLRIYASMPVLEDGLSSGHASDTDNNNPTVMLMKRQINEIEKEIIQRSRVNDTIHQSTIENDSVGKDLPGLTVSKDILHSLKTSSPDLFVPKKENSYDTNELQLDGLDPLGTPPPPAPQARQNVNLEIGGEVEAAIKDIRMALQRTKTLPVKSSTEEPPEPNVSPIWIPSLSDGRRRICVENNSEESEVRRTGEEADIEIEEGPDEEEADTDLETDRLLGQQRTDDQGFYDDKGWRKPKTRTMLPPMSGKVSTPKQTPPKSLSVVPVESPLAPSEPLASTSACVSTSASASISPPPVVSVIQPPPSDCDVSTPTQPATSPQKTPAKNSPSSPQSLKESSNKVKKEKEEKKKSRNKEALLNDSSVLIEGVLFRARYLGSTQLVCEGEPTKSTRMCQAEEAVSRIKALAPDGETQPSTEVDLFISTEKIMVLNTDLKEIMMDHALRTISYIADIGDVVVLMARRRFVPHEMEEAPKINRTPKMICHVFESEEARFIAQSIGQAFQVAYMEFLKANGIEDHSFVKEMDYQEVLNSQEIFGDELQMFAKKEMQKEVVVPKAKGEILGVVIVESGWGSMLPTVVIANLAPAGAAARCGQLNIGDQIIAINGVSLVGLPLSTCQTYIKNSKNQTVVKLTVVPCAPVVEVKIKRPDTKYQLGFSVQNGVICSLLRGGIAERGGVRVGHRIIEINNQSVVAVPHEKIVNLLATSVGEILMKTMPTSMFRLLTGQESPVYI
ncbi:serine-rich adhesin for platelets-like isoform X6 [Frieseomelitta varia]|uniref:serine-rich adhesin for platelets-like isoform X6 n=1 Tax=Frieseomelitta varia TaxID=561572 RepID=UPI001CB67CCE|nr:serine-rich adhesin for platelets-like isoform X6 [Frieseomelitta varia]